MCFKMDPTDDIKMIGKYIRLKTASRLIVASPPSHPSSNPPRHHQLSTAASTRPAGFVQVMTMEIKVLSFPADSPPLLVIAAAKLAGITIPTETSGSAPTFSFSNGSKLQGTYVLLRYIGRVGNFYGQNAYEAGEIDEWLDYTPVFSSGSEFENACTYVDKYLERRTFVVGHSLSIVDIAIWSALAGKEYSDSLDEVTATYVSNRGLGKPTAAKSKEQQGVKGDVSEKGKAGSRPSFEVDLPDAEIGKVRLRFAPEPSGYLHIGHSKAALLNQYFAQRYQGQLIVRFDDTNPAKESNEFVDNLLKDIETLGIKYETVTYTSDYFPDLMEMAENLIRQGKAYVDDTPREQMQKERMDGIESKCRNNSIEENMKLWKEMIAGSERGLECCLRGKLDMQDPNKSLRDPVYYRCNPIPHHRIGSKYKVYPTYDFACPFVDAKEGITHALRSSEYHDRNAQYYRIQEDLGVRKVHIYEFSRLNMVYTLLSKRKLLWFVQNGKVDGWDDPRFPTVQGIVRRGLLVEALIQFILEQGASKNLNLMEWDKLWTINKKIIDPVCPRHTAVIEDRRVLLTLTDGPDKPFVRIIPRHKKYEGAGEKATTYTKRIWIDHADAQLISANEEITLMDWGNAIVKEISRDQDGNVTQLSGFLHLEGSVKTTKLKLTWLPETNELVNLTLVGFDYLITKKKLEEGEDFLDVLNPCTRFETAAIGDSNMRNLKRGEILQLERKGYFRCDVPFTRSSKPVVLFAIPDGRQQAVFK
ncbi:glutamate--tRNA ligase cytoplasmic [Citrus sinensis]|uniref:Glutamate--tRNA ligase cytoplasmic n=1 Tax=Citrus sinensis TaxID=2711 RepID=A0ACB8K8B1_CITSI|nr:glutamate--tRNA ligase cytoplasmic [Citrus sinensis]